MGTVHQNTVHWQPLPEDTSRYVESFVLGSNYMGMDKYYFDTKFLTGIQIVKSFGTFILRLSGKNLDKQSFSFGMMQSKEDIRFKSTQASKTESMTGKTPGLASGLNITYPDYKISKDIELHFRQETPETLLPFFDPHDVSFDIKAPIAGIGFYHYTNNNGYSGFIRPYLVALDYQSFFEMD